MSQELPNSFDDFLKEDQEQSEKKQESLQARFQSERAEWTEKIKEMSKKLKNVLEISLLQVDVYTERQRCVEYYHYIVSLLIKINKEYRKQYASKYDYYTNQSQIRYPNETTKTNKILTELSDIVNKKEALENHSKFVNATISTLDNIIYGIKSRIDLENIIRGK
jgi:hypothetical protein